MGDWTAEGKTNLGRAAPINYGGAAAPGEDAAANRAWAIATLNSTCPGLSL